MPNYELENKAKQEEAIIRVVVFFDLFDYPLTAYELWHYLDKGVALIDLERILFTTSELEQRDGFFFLRGRQEIITTRRKRHNYSLRKFKIAQNFIRFFKFLPFIKMIALSNSLGQFNLRDESDIDFFIISSTRRVWLTRLVCAGFAKILNRRPTTKNKRDKICLSFYISEESLNLDGLKLSGEDPYLYYWLRSLILLYNKDRTYEKFLAANQINFLDDVSTLNSPPALSMGNLPVKNVNIALDFLELLAKKIQFIIMSPALKQAMNNSAGVVISDKVLKLYLRDNRRVYAEKYGDKISQLFKEGN